MSSIGQQLVEARERSGKSVQDIERAIKIRAKYVEALEADEFDAIPGDAYVAGFLRSYCEFLGIDATPLVEAYRAEHETPKLTIPQPVMSTTKEHPRFPRFVWAGILALAGLAFAGWMALGLVSALKPSTPVPEPTVTPVVAEPTATPKPKTQPKPKAHKRRIKKPRPFTLKVKALEASNWISARVDGHLVHDGEIPKGKSYSWLVRKRIVLRSDTSELLEVYRNGNLLGLFGQGFEIQTRVFKPKVT